ncbi:MAG: hypothetical protein K0S99_3100 [Thermomicrobiales bacterium]|nr:hypothetical protein [Thermomicrobiales bacterium]
MSDSGWVELLGAAAFGALIGWYVYYINRYRKSDVQFSDLTTIIAIIGGAAVLNLFPSSTPLFGAYGIGLFIGFFGYFVSLLLLIRSSDNFNADFLLDGRRRELAGTGYYIPGDFVRPAFLPQAVIQGSANRDANASRAHMPVTAPNELAPAALAMSFDESQQAQTLANDLRAATIDAQRALAALSQADVGSRRTGLQVNPTPEPGD